MDKHRPIKYRAWADGKMHAVRAISFTEDGVLHRILDGQGVQRLPTHLMQYTGLANNGEDWYDGDILENDCDWYRIGWDNDQARWEAIGIRSTGETLALSELISSETWVQGNVYENPELLRSEHG